jgi:uncharacterized protein YndB with AHSA1/START domain
MNVTISPAPVRRSVTIRVSQQRAFDVFTRNFGQWWPKSHSIIGKSPQKTAAIEPYVGGRWFETGEDGSECDWGEVLAWEPPHRVLLAWRIGLNWSFDPKIHTEVEVRFTPLPEGGTRVDLVHGKLDGYGDRAEEARATFEGDGAWGSLLDAFAALAEAT